ncbi:MAG TPA: hypothetical protein VEW95_05460 [Candidatus Limnocylindrales bacterium]|nr:hypothetical protein [Candidatus Limnocylindrales bacterium]
MSQGQPVPLDRARPLAEELVTLLRDSCERVEIAGSIRREKAMVADIEIVAMPKIETGDGGDLWGTPVEMDRLAERLEYLRRHDIVTARDVDTHRRSGVVETQHKLGDRYQALVYATLPVDLFIVRDPDQWGLIFALRTGPGDWNTRLVTDCKRYLRRVEGGYVYRSGQRVPCPEERDFFRALGQPWVEPRDRRVGRVDIRAEVPA